MAYRHPFSFLPSLGALCCCPQHTAYTGLKGYRLDTGPERDKDGVARQR